MLSNYICIVGFILQVNPALYIAEDRLGHNKTLIMIKHRNILIILITLTLFAGCSKKNSSIITGIDKFVIFLSNDYQINKVEHYTNGNTINYVITFYYSKQLIVINRKYINNISNSIQCYYLNSFGLADSCVDSVFNNSKLTDFSIIKYQYNNGYLIHSDIIDKSIINGVVIYVSTSSRSYTIENGNVLLIACEGSDCDSYSFKYTGNKNYVDINDFLNDFCGKKNANLIESVTIACPNLNENSFNYKLNYQGLVIEKTSIFSSNRIFVTTYEYIFQ